MLALILGLLSVVSFASDNGYYYKCDTDFSTDWCYYTLVAELDQNADYPLPAGWYDYGAQPHSVDRDTDMGMRKIINLDQQTLNVSPKPWANGENMVPLGATDSPVTGDNWNYGLVFEMVAEIRNRLMYDPPSLEDPAEWAKYTKVFTDCGVKINPLAVNEHGMDEDDSDETYVWLTSKPSIHHTGLQYLEESAIDLVCLVTSLDGMTRCTTIRDNYGITMGDLCDCWIPAYVDLFGEDPQIDAADFQECPGITAAVAALDDADDSTPDTDPADDTTPTGPHCCDGSDPVSGATGPPTCTDGSTALQPTEECPTEEPTALPTVTPEPPTATPTGPYCCDGSEPDMDARPPTCADGSMAIPPTDSCDGETHTMQAKCTSDAIEILPYHMEDISVYACMSNVVDICSTDTELCTEEQIASLEEDICSDLSIWGNFEGECDPDTGNCVTCGDESLEVNGSLCCEYTTQVYDSCLEYPTEEDQITCLKAEVLALEAQLADVTEQYDQVLIDEAAAEATCEQARQDIEDAIGSCGV